MAYALFSKGAEEFTITYTDGSTGPGYGNKYKIAANDEELNQINCDQNCYVVVTITDQEFDYLRYNETKDCKGYKYDTNSIIWVDKVAPNWTESYVSLEALEDEIAGTKEAVDRFISESPSHAQIAKWQQFRTDLDAVDTSGITFPTTNMKSLQRIMLDQGLTALHTLQLPN
jgi:hypothetical protein